MSGTEALIDISVRLRAGMPEWPGDTPYACQWTWRIAEGASVNVSSVTASPHVGTHADAPLHVRDDGLAAHALPLEAFLGPATVVTIGDLSRPVEVDDLQLPTARAVERLLVRTGQTIASGPFPDRWSALSERCVRTLLARGLRLLGVDAPSVDDRDSKTLPVHQALFAGGACVLENLDLRNAPDGDYELLALPLNVEGLDAAPVRAALRPLPHP